MPIESFRVEVVEQMARAKGVSREELLRSWVRAKAQSSKERLDRR